MKKKIGYLVQVLIVGLIFFFLIRNLSGNWELARESLGKFKPVPLVLSAIFLGLGFMLLVRIWTLILRETGEKLPYAAACKVWFASNMGKYLPGKIWQILGMVYLAEKKGIPKLKSFSTAVVAQFFSVVSGLLLAAICFGFHWYPELPGWGGLIQIVSTVLILVCLVFIFAPRTLESSLNLLLRLLRKETVEFYFDTRKIITYLFCYGLSWLLFGAGLFFFAAGITEVVPGFLWKATGAFSGAMVLGFLAVIVPGGLGVREGVLAFLLSSSMPLPVTTLVALLYRLWFTLVEVVLFGISFLIRD